MKAGFDDSAWRRATSWEASGAAKLRDHLRSKAVVVRAVED